MKRQHTGVETGGAGPVKVKAEVGARAHRSPERPAEYDLMPFEDKRP